MSIFSRPKGTIVTPFNEWSNLHMAMGGGSTAAALTAGGNVALFNNANDGSLFYVYLISCSSLNNGDLSYFFAPGVGTNNLGACQFIESGAGTPFGLIFAEAAPIAIPASAPTFASGVDSIPLVSTYPLFVLRSGYRLVIQSAVPGDELDGAFWYRIGTR